MGRRGTADRGGLVHLEMQRILAVFKIAKQVRQIRVIDWLARVIGQEILLGDIGDVVAFVVFREQMIERLVLARARLLGNGIVPFLRVRKLGVDIKNNPTKGVPFVSDHLSQREFGLRLKHIIASPEAHR